MHLHETPAYITCQGSTAVESVYKTFDAQRALSHAVVTTDARQYVDVGGQQYFHGVGAPNEMLRDFLIDEIAFSLVLGSV